MWYVVIDKVVGYYIRECIIHILYNTHIYSVFLIELCFSNNFFDFFSVEEKKTNRAAHKSGFRYSFPNEYTPERRKMRTRCFECIVGMMIKSREKKTHTHKTAIK